MAPSVPRWVKNTEVASIAARRPKCLGEVGCAGGIVTRLGHSCLRATGANENRRAGRRVAGLDVHHGQLNGV